MGTRIRGKPLSKLHSETFKALLVRQDTPVSSSAPALGQHLLPLVRLSTRAREGLMKSIQQFNRAFAQPVVKVSAGQFCGPAKAKLWAAG